MIDLNMLKEGIEIVAKGMVKRCEIDCASIYKVKDVIRIDIKDTNTIQIEEETVKVKYLKDIDRIETFNIGDWVDLRCSEDVTLKQGEFKYIPLGVAIQLPKGYEALVVPRSSTFKKYGLIQTNSVGIIDESYCGGNDEWHMPVIAVRDTSILKNDRICQFRIIKHQPHLSFEPVQELTNPDRGGLGSTGVK